MALFATTTDLGELVGETFTGTRLAQATTALEMASALIQGYTRQRLERVVDDTITLPGTYDWELELPERPVISVGAVTLDGTAVTTDSYRLADSTLVRVGGWTGPASTVVVTYTHGYDPIPDDIRTVTLQLAVRTLSNPSGVRQEGIGSYNVSYGDENPGGAVMQALSRYRRTAVSLPMYRP